MGRKIFVSYKYWDRNVDRVYGITKDYENPKARDYVTWLENKFVNRTEHYYKGESENEDLSYRGDEYIWGKLKDKIYDSSITIVLISPNMKESFRWEKSQWIPWEVSYSLRKTTRRNYESQRNALLAVILPDAHGSYSYYKRDGLFRILKENISIGYIPEVKWEDFKYNCDRYINLAYESQKSVPEYKIKIEI